MPPWLLTTSNGLRLRLKVVPNARRTQVDGPHGDALKIRLAAPPVDGKANAALVEFLADTLGLPRLNIQVETGATGRWKSVRLLGISAEAATAKLAGASQGQ